jgi:maleate cis-trans isomerase
MNWQTPSEALKKSILATAESENSSDCILVTGGGMRLLDIANEMEQEVCKPIIGGDLAIYWGILRHLPNGRKVRGHGKLLSSLP